MGSQPSTVSKLRDLDKVSKAIDKHLPCITGCRISIVVLLCIATVFMSTAASTIFSQGGRVAGALVTIALALHLKSFVLREFVIIRRLDEILDNVYRFESKPKLREDGLVFSVSMFMGEIFALAVGFAFDGYEVQFWLIIAAFTLLISSLAFLLKVKRDKNDDHFKEACQLCRDTLYTRLEVEEEA